MYHRESDVKGMEHSTAQCRLLRADGSEWHVIGLYYAEQGLEVDAIHFRVPSVGDGGPVRNVPSLHRLEEEPLSRGDLLQWIGEDGDVLWSMTAPVRPLRA